MMGTSGLRSSCDTWLIFIHKRVFLNLEWLFGCYFSAEFLLQEPGTAIKRAMNCESCNLVFRIILQTSITVGNAEAFLANSLSELVKFPFAKVACSRLSVNQGTARKYGRSATRASHLFSSPNFFSYQFKIFGTIFNFCVLKQWKVKCKFLKN